MVLSGVFGRKPNTTQGTCLKQKVIQGNQSFLTFQHYFQIFHSVFDQLCDPFPWQL